MLIFTLKEPQGKKKEYMFLLKDCAQTNYLTTMSRAIRNCRKIFKAGQNMNKYVTPGTVDMVNEVELSTTVLISLTPDKKKQSNNN